MIYRALVICRFLLTLLPLGLCGCYAAHTAATTQSTTSIAGLDKPMPLTTVEAIVAPPAGWIKQPLKLINGQPNQFWLSPSGDTAYGVIHVHMPLPAGPDLALLGVVAEMRRAEGEATLLEKNKDDSLEGIRFVIEGGRYRLRGDLITHGWVAWVIYAGTLRSRPVAEDELALAQRARAATIPGMP